MTLKHFSVLDLMELFSQLVVELRLRGDLESSEHIVAASLSHARFAVSPEAPSDDGPGAPGADEADRPR